jgi:outer membrane protein, heavy metal efflux system
MKNPILKIVLCVVISGFTPLFAQAQDISSEQTSIPSGKTELSTFIQLAWQSNPKIEESQARVEAARARQKAASRWLRNPEIEFEQEDVEGEELTQTFGLSQEIDLTGKSFASGKVAKFEYRAVEATHDLVLQDVTLSILEALIDSQTQRESAGLYKRRTELMTRFVGLATQKREAGDIGESELNLAKLALAETLMGQAESLSGLARSERDLQAAIGYPIASPADLPGLPQQMPVALLDTYALDDTIMDLPSLRVLRNELDASRAAITSARLKKLPDPTISVRGGTEAGQDIVGLSVSFPLNVLNPFRAEVDAAKHDATAQDRAFYGALYAAKPALLASKQRYDVTLAAWEAWNSTGAGAISNQIESLDLKYAVGELSATDYLVQVEQVLNIEITALELRFKTWQAWFEWLSASGGTVNWVIELGEEK